MEKSNCRATGEGDVIEGTRRLVGALRKGEISVEGSAKYFIVEDKGEQGDYFVVEVVDRGELGFSEEIKFGFKVDNHWFKVVIADDEEDVG